MKVLLLTGGSSGEREVSLSSGAAVFDALHRLGHEVTAIDPSTGKLLLGPDGKFLSVTEVTPDEISAVESSKPHALANSLAAAHMDDVDVVFIALHGGTGENGTIQSLLHLVGKKYTGSDMTASAVAMNKAMTKRLMAAVDVPTPRWALCQLERRDSVDDVVDEIKHYFPCPVIVKPNDGGSTIGLSKVTRQEDIAEAVQMAAGYSSQVLVEEYIAGRELTVSVFDGKAYPVVEIKAESGLYDYEAKYTKGKSEYVAPANLESTLTEKMKQAAERVYEAVGASGLVRVDFILDKSNDFYCLEVNTLPGMTSLSLSPMSLGCAGISFDQLVNMIIESALKHET
ncbi:MAG: D-alanine--D-alanine ligase [Candidatus Zixiibacteriota bacterium]|nr:MAG: D-alanine--D-alanine ligase [candidate division Zixibacteria bacterium]